MIDPLNKMLSSLPVGKLYAIGFIAITYTVLNGKVIILIQRGIYLSQPPTLPPSFVIFSSAMTF